MLNDQLDRLQVEAETLVMDTPAAILVSIPGVAVSAVALIHIPRPPISAEGAAAIGGFWAEWRGGLRFLTTRRALLGLILYYTGISFLLNGPLELVIPYVLALTNDEGMLGVLIGVMSGGALAAAVLIALWGGTRPRIHTLMPGMLLTAVMMVLFGVSRHPMLLGMAIFFTMIPLPISNVVFISILQVKTPPDLQGRVFAVAGHLASIITPLSFVLTGPLVDGVLEPAFGNNGDGMGVVLVAAGIIIGVLTLLAYAQPALRHLERDLQDYGVEPSEP